jgi:hypothetical protein
MPVHSTSWLRRAVALGLMISLGACYTQRPLALPVPAVATRIVATVTDSGVVAMSSAIGPGATEVEGVVVSADANSWTLEMLRVDHRGRSSVTWNREHVTFAPDAFTNVTERTLDKKRSLLTAGLITASAVLIGGLFGAITGGGDEGEQSGQTENVAPVGGRAY